MYVHIIALTYCAWANCAIKSITVFPHTNPHKFKPSRNQTLSLCNSTCRRQICHVSHAVRSHEDLKKILTPRILSLGSLCFAKCFKKRWHSGPIPRWFRKMRRKRSHLNIQYPQLIFLGCTWRHHFLKSKTKEPPNILSSSGTKDGKIYICEQLFSSETCFV